MDRLQRLRFVTERYSHLQGLRLIPVAIPFLLSAMWRAGCLGWVPDTGGRGAEHWFAIVFALALVAAAVLGLFYRRRFGEVQSAWRLRGRLTLVSALIVLAVAIWLQSRQPTMISLPLLVIGIVVGCLGVVDGLTRPHYLIVSGFCLVLAMLGTFGVAPHTRVVLLDAVIGIGLIVIGLGDDRVLRRTLRPASHVQSL